MVVLFCCLLFPVAEAFEKLSGAFLAEKECPVFQSIKKQTNPKKQRLIKGESYSLLGENKPGGGWVQIKMPGGEVRWVSKQCGEVTGLIINKPDFFTLAMSSFPAFCSKNKNKRLPECKSQPHSHSFVLHGLWPSNKQGKHPAFCNGSEKRSACDYRPIGLSGKQLAFLEEVMPGVKSCYQRYQWYKHGVCSGMTAEIYFERASGYARWFQNSPVALAFKKHAGKTVMLEQVRGWLKAWGIDSSSSLHCYQAKKGAVFKEIRLYFSGNLVTKPDHHSLIDAPYSNQCPNEFFLEQ